MSMGLDATHDPTRRSWVRSAQQAGTDFPLQNLPVGVFRRRRRAESFRGGVAIGDQILDLRALAATELLKGEAQAALTAAAQPELNQFLQMGAEHWRALRAALFELLEEHCGCEQALLPCLVPQLEAEHAVPARIGDYTDFYTSIHHASAVGRLFRPDQPLTPNYRWLPIGYHGRASSIEVSEQRFHRPCGQRLPAGESRPVFGPSLKLDFELELGAYVGPGNELGRPVPIAQADEHLFGLCLLNDWSARDVQAFEYQPLGPFLAKSFATTLSPWIVSLEALAPFRVPPVPRGAEDPPLPVYLRAPATRNDGFDITLAVELQSAVMRERGEPAQRLALTNYRHAYWTLAQLLAHHTCNGCNLRPGDLIGTGTQSGPEPAEAGSLLELTGGGKQPIRLSSGEQRTFLEDGDTVILKAWCERPGAMRIGFGEARGTVLPVEPHAEAR
jgi:fumarylacetoacetase